MGRSGAAPPSPSNTNPMDRSTTSEGDFLIYVVCMSSGDLQI
jgi:hypothetical protein